MRRPLSARQPGAWAWQEVRRFYQMDRVEAAYEMTLRLGMGEDASRSFFFRRVEAEHLTRQRSVTTPVNDWLSVEYVPEEIPDPGVLIAQVVAACDEIARRFEWSHGPKVLVTVLAEDTDAPWLPGRYGVFIDKDPYDKICIPRRAALDPARLHAVIIHEYAHEIVQDLTQGRAPRWLNEMVAMIAEGGPSREIAAQFASGQLIWLDEKQLAMQYVLEAEGKGKDRANAYWQSACIGAYLVFLKGEKQLAAMLRSFSERSVLMELLMRGVGARPEERAFRRIYGMSEREVFARALEWLKERSR